MLILRKIAGETSEAPSGTLTLDYERRRLSRQRATLDSGEDVALLLPRGTVLADGTVLRGDDGRLVVIRAAKEGLSRVQSDDLLLLARAAYHLGNRHVPLEIRPGLVSYAHDHVLDEMIRHLGLEPTFDEAPFDPEQGAYTDGHHDVPDSESHDPPAGGYSHEH